MADPTTRIAVDPTMPLSRPAPAASPLFLRDGEVQRGLDLMLIAHGHLLRTIDPVLREQGLTRAHFRLLTLVARWPGQAMRFYIDLSGITKQALSRTAADLQQRGMIVMDAGLRDRRQKTLRLSANGSAIESALAAQLRASLADAYGVAGQQAVTGFWRVCEGLIPLSEKIRIDQAVGLDQA